MLDEQRFVRATFSNLAPGSAAPWKKAVVRPVVVRDSRKTQISYFDERRDVSKNYARPELEARLDELLDLGFRAITVETTAATLQIQYTAAGKPRIHEVTRVDDARAPTLQHDRQKRAVLPAAAADPFLRAIGITTAEGTIKADKRDKYRQINDFLELVRPTVALAGPVSIVDCGCGNAYLTFATYHYVAHVLGLPVQLAGIDVRDDLMTKHVTVAQELGWTGLTFHGTSIIDFQPASPPEIVLALHACDTATDEALAQGIRWGSHYLFSAPCCHHHLQAQIDGRGAPPLFAPVYRHGILGERMGDLLTDALRALILRIMGYRTEVVQFVSSEHTARNVMIRAVYVGDADRAPFVEQYRDLVTYWGVTPYLQTLLGDRFTALLAA